MNESINKTENSVQMNADGLITLLDGIAKEQIDRLPHSADGNDCQAISRFEYLDTDGEPTDPDAIDATLIYEIVFGFDNEDDEMSFSVEIPILDGRYDGQRLDSELESLKASLNQFYGELDGKCHTEYLSTLAKERYLTIAGEGDEKPPFDYRSFFIGASIVSVALILMLLLVNELLPRLL